MEPGDYWSRNRFGWRIYAGLMPDKMTSCDGATSAADAENVILACRSARNRNANSKCSFPSNGPFAAAPTSSTSPSPISAYGRTG